MSLSNLKQEDSGPLMSSYWFTTIIFSPSGKIILIKNCTKSATVAILLTELCGGGGGGGGGAHRCGEGCAHRDKTNNTYLVDN